MTAIRDEIVESIFQRKANITLNFGVGVLSLFHAGTSQFKSISVQEEKGEQRDEADRVKECSEFDRKSKLTEEGLRSLGAQARAQSASQLSEHAKQSIAERSLNYMQQRQQHEGVQKNPSISHGTDTRITKAIAPNSAKVAESPYFDRRNQRINSTKGRTDKDGTFEGKNYDALNGFLRNQIELTAYSDGKKGNKRSNTNNAVIEAAAQLKAKGTRDQVMDYVRSASAHSKS